MSKIWYCVTCGYEVGSRGRCHLCKQRLTASDLPELEAGDTDDEVGYRLGDWADADRGRLIARLNDLEVLHRFEDDELVVATEDEERVDDLIAELSAGSDDGDSDGPVGAGRAGDRVGAGGRPVGPVDETVRAAVTLLADGAARLREDPTDMLADGDVAQASTAVFVVDEYPGADPETWAAIGRVTRRLLGALGADEALESEIRTQAGVLARLLAPVVEAGRSRPTGATAAADPPVGGAAVTDAGTTPADEPAGAGAADALDEAAPGEDERPDDERPDGEPADDGADDGDVDDEGADDDVVYELIGWLPEQRAQLDLLLEEAAIDHEWDGDDLIVPADSESVVEGLFDQVGREDEGDDEEDEARYHALEELFAAAGRLASEPDDEDRIEELRNWIDTVDGPTPVGMDEAVWLRITNRAHALSGSLDAGADGRVVSAEAGALRDLLRSIV